MSRVWDAFLTDRDKEHLAAGWGKKEPFGLGRRPALLVIDNSVCVLGERPQPLLESVRDFRFQMGYEAWEAIEKTKELLDTARRRSVQVVHTTLGRPYPWVPFLEYDIIARFARGTEIVPELEPLPTEVVIGKAGASGFHGSPLLSHLIAAQVDTVVVCGNSTSGCLRATVVDAACYGFLVAVVEDCTFDRTEASHAMSLFDMEQKYADVISLADAVAYLDGIVDGEPARSRLVSEAWASVTAPAPAPA